MMKRALCILAFACWASASQSASFSDKWDEEFRDATALHLPPGTDWRLLKAQCYQESRLRPHAVSPVGASGLCQFMPGTWREVQGALDVGPEDVWLPEASIRAAAWYMGRMHRLWSSPRPAIDRYMISAASYNAGAGNLLKAQRRCGGALLYKDIVRCLPGVTGHHSEETIGYVRLIMTRWYPRLIFN